MVVEQHLKASPKLFTFLVQIFAKIHPTILSLTSNTSTLSFGRLDQIFSVLSYSTDSLLTRRSVWQLFFFFFCKRKRNNEPTSESENRPTSEFLLLLDLTKLRCDVFSGCDGVEVMAKIGHRDLLNVFQIHFVYVPISFSLLFLWLLDGVRSFSLFCETRNHLLLGNSDVWPCLWFSNQVPCWRDCDIRPDPTLFLLGLVLLGLLPLRSVLKVVEDKQSRSEIRRYSRLQSQIQEIYGYFLGTLNQKYWAAWGVSRPVDLLEGLSDFFHRIYELIEWWC